MEEIRKAAAPVDFCVVGGGATGLGVAVDAASRGHSVVLVEQSDFAKGTSSRSTKLVHGGVRYLRQGNLPLVFEALLERGRLAENAPHLVKDLAFIIPGYSRWQCLFYGLGMKLYDLLAGRRSLGRSRLLSGEETLARLPTLSGRGLAGGVLYHDGQFDDSRLALSLARTAVGAGARLVNYTRCAGLLKEDGRVTGLMAEDRESGRVFPILAKCVVNAAGIFVDELRMKDDHAAKPVVTVSQGIHLVLPREFLPGDDALMIPKTADGRVLFALPWHDRVVLGTTDTPVPEKILEPRALDEEIDFLMEHAGKYLVKAPEPEDVLSVFAGLRPLVKAGDDTETAALSREHAIITSGSGLVTVTGGKWTTYRRMAEDVVDRGELSAGLARKKCVTAEMRLRGWTREEAPESHLKAYGADAAGVRALGGSGWVHPAIGLTVGEVRWHAREEMARTVEDVLARRTRWLLLDARGSIKAAEAVARVLASELGRDGEWVAKQVAEYESLARGYVFGNLPPVEHPPSS